GRRICFCWWGGNTAMMRLIVSVASSVCRVEKTRWPVSAASRPVSIVSKSRISPTRMTSGSCRSALRSACANDRVSTATSRWFTIDLLSRCRNSIGSSTVITCAERVVLMKSIIAESVVLLPLRRRHDGGAHGDDVVVVELLFFVHRHERAADAHHREGADLQVQVRRPALDGDLEQIVNVHGRRPSAASEARLPPGTRTSAS